MVIDCHVHISQFGPGNEGQPFPRVRDNLLQALKRHGIACALVYPDSEPGTVVSDLEATCALVAGHPELRMLGAAAVPEDGEVDPSTLARLGALAGAGEIVGIKLYPGFELFYPGDARCHPVYELCVAHDIPVVFHSGETMNEPWREAYNHPRKIAKVAERFPDLKVVVAHFSQPHLDDCRDLILGYPNVHADISGMAHPEVIACCGQEKIKQVLEEVVAQQPEKVLFGTDWPICDVEEHLRLVASLAVPETAKALILSGNPRRVFGLA